MRCARARALNGARTCFLAQADEEPLEVLHRGPRHQVVLEDYARGVGLRGGAQGRVRARRGRKGAAHPVASAAANAAAANAAATAANAAAAAGGGCPSSHGHRGRGVLLALEGRQERAHARAERVARDGDPVPRAAQGPERRPHLGLEPAGGPRHARVRSHRRPSATTAAATAAPSAATTAAPSGVCNRVRPGSSHGGGGGRGGSARHLRQGERQGERQRRQRLGPELRVGEPVQGSVRAPDHEHRPPLGRVRRHQKARPALGARLLPRQEAVAPEPEQALGLGHGLVGKAQGEGRVAQKLAQQGRGHGQRRQGRLELGGVGRAPPPLDLGHLVVHGAQKVGHGGPVRGAHVARNRRHGPGGLEDFLVVEHCAHTLHPVLS